MKHIKKMVSVLYCQLKMVFRRYRTYAPQLPSPPRLMEESDSDTESEEMSGEEQDITRPQPEKYVMKGNKRKHMKAPVEKKEKKRLEPPSTSESESELDEQVAPPAKKKKYPMRK